MYKLLDRPVAVGVAGVAVLALGLICLRLVPIDIGGVLDAPQLTVRVGWPGVSALTVESQITAPLESLVQSLRGVVRLRSTSSAGHSYITAEFAPDTDIQLAELALAEKIYSFRRQMPPGAAPPRIQYTDPDQFNNPNFVRLMLLGREDPVVLRQYADDRLKLALQSVPGVEQVTVRGGAQQHILLEMNHLLARHWQVDQGVLSQALAAQGIQTRFLGAAPNQGLLSSIQIRGNLADLETLEYVPLKRLASGRFIYLKDVATVRYRPGSPSSLYRINGFNAIALQFEKTPGSDMIRTSQQIRDKVAELAQQLPEGLEIVALHDKGAEVERDFRFLRGWSAFSIAFIAWVLIGVFRQFQTVLLVLSSIWLSVLGAVILFFAFGIHLNLATLAGFTIGFGLIVDNAIVIYDYLHRRVQSLAPGGDVRAAVAAGLREGVHPIVVSNLTTLGAFLPVFFLSRELQGYFEPFVVALGLTLTIALLVALTLIPTFFYWMVARSVGAPVASTDRCYRLYRAVLFFCVRHKVMFLGLVAWMVGVPLWLLPDRLGDEREFVPATDKITTQQQYKAWLATRDTTTSSSFFGNVIFSSKRAQADRPIWQRLYAGGADLYNQAWSNPIVSAVKPALFKGSGGATYFLFGNLSHRLDRRPPRHILQELSEGFSLIVSLRIPHNAHISRMDKILQDIEKQLFNFAPYIEGIIAQSAGRYGLIQVLLKEEYRTSEIPYVLYERLAAYEGNLGGVGMSIYGKGLEGIGKPLGGSRSVSNQLSIHGFNFGQVGNIANDMAARLRQRRSRRIKDIHIDFAYGPSQREIVAQFDHAKTASIGLSHADVTREIQNRLATSSPAAQVYVDGRQYAISVADTGASRMSTRRLSQVALDAHPARIGHVAHIEQQAVTPSIKREDQRYIRTIGFTVLGSHSYSRSILQDIVAHTPLPYGYSLSNPTMYRMDQKEQRELGGMVLLAVLLVWMIAAALFESWTQPLLVLVALPLTLIGIGAALFLFNAPFNQGGYAALLLLMGIAVNNSILLVYAISNALKRRPADPTEAITQAAFQRLRPIFITTLTTVAGFLPMLLQGDKTDFWYTLALGTSGGLVSSSILLILVVPLCAVWRIRVRPNAKHGTGVAD